MIAAMRGQDVDTIKRDIEAENLQKRILEPDELGPWRHCWQRLNPMA
jgi:hypothetical protein